MTTPLTTTHHSDASTFPPPQKLGYQIPSIFYTGYPRDRASADHPELGAHGEKGTYHSVNRALKGRIKGHVQMKTSIVVQEGDD